MSDNIIAVKTAIHQFVRAELVLEFPTYFTSPNEQIYWENTRINDRGGFPYCFLEIENEEVLGFGDFELYKVVTVDGVKHLYRVDKEFNVLTIGFNFCAMRDDLNGSAPLNGLEAQSIAQRMARHIRRKLRSDDALDWFNYAENDASLQIGLQTENLTDISYLSEYEETKPKHRFRFTCPFNWTDVYETEMKIASQSGDIANFALGANLIYLNDTQVDIQIDKP